MSEEEDEENRKEKAKDEQDKQNAWFVFCLVFIICGIIASVFTSTSGNSKVTTHTIQEVL